jgi:cell division septation protein DedD
MERRQAVILLVLLLVTSLASFIVGSIVGHRGAELDLAAKQQVEEVLVEQSTPASQSVPERSVVESVEPVSLPEVLKQEQPELSFYDDLSREPTLSAEPLGSGINLAPATEVEPPIPLPAQPVVVKETPAIKPQAVAQVPAAVPVVSVPTAIAMPEAASTGSHAVQIGSFNSSGDALALKKKMQARDYPAYMVEADLGGKGLWYRVRVGPYASVATAKLAQRYLQEREQIEGFVSSK